MNMLTGQEILRVVNEYIGVEGGYLLDFTYSNHQEFYPYYCGLNIDPLKLENMTTRQRFIHILETVSPLEQAKILRGVLAKCPPQEHHKYRTKNVADEIKKWADRCEKSAVSGNFSLSFTSDVVERAILDAEVLIRENGATSGIDRIHTTLHGYFLAICDGVNISHNNEASVTALFGLLRQHHPKLQPIGPRADDITRMLRSLSTIIDALNPLRNQASVAHPNPNLLAEDEAWLVINAARALLHYIEKKVG